jgi:hypothetical protein
MYAFKLRRGTSVDWSSNNPTLRSGEPGYETDSGRFKIGNGYTPWNQLPYFIDEDRITELLAESGQGDVATVMNTHINSETPHPVYDDGPSLTLLYENAKV